MKFFLSFLAFCHAAFKLYGQSFQLTRSQNDHKFEINKEVDSDDCLAVVNVDSQAYFEYQKTGTWDISAKFFDLVSWIQGSNILKVSLPGTTSGTAYVGLYCNKEVPYFKVEKTEKSKTSCLFPCKNQGVCQKGGCLCKENYGGEDCSVYFARIPDDDKTEFSVGSFQWKFFHVTSDSDLYMRFKSKSAKALKLYIKSTSNSGLPTMIDSKEYKTSSSFSKTFSSSSNNLRISLLCMSPSGGCSGSLEFSSISYESYLWVIIFSVIVGIFFVGAIPLILIYCKKNGKNQVRVVQINKSQLEKMFPGQEWEGETREVCSICLEELKGQKLCRVLGCGHVFHADCIDEWAESNLACPVCKQNLIDEYFQKKHDNGKEVLLTENA